jgi:hypothetical protein
VGIADLSALGGWSAIHIILLKAIIGLPMT